MEDIKEIAKRWFPSREGIAELMQKVEADLAAAFQLPPGENRFQKVRSICSGCLSALGVHPMETDHFTTALLAVLTFEPGQIGRERLMEQIGQFLPKITYADVEPPEHQTVQQHLQLVVSYLAGNFEKGDWGTNPDREKYMSFALLLNAFNKAYSEFYEVKFTPGGTA